jgi:hypothetical protein
MKRNGHHLNVSAVESVNHRLPGHSQQPAEPGPQPLAAVEFEMQDEGAKQIAIKTEAARSVKSEFSDTAIATACVQGRRGVVGNERQATAGTKRAAPGFQRIPAITTDAGQTDVGEFLITERAGGWKDNRKQTAGDFSQEGRCFRRWRWRIDEDQPRFPPGRPESEQALFLFLLALDAVTRPGNRLQPFLLDLFLTGDTASVIAILDAGERFFDKLENAAMVVTLMEEEFLGVRIGGLVGDVLGDFFIDLPPVLLRLGDKPQQLFLLTQQAFPVVLDFLFVHALPCQEKLVSTKQSILGALAWTVKVCRP